MIARKQRATVQDAGKLRSVGISQEDFAEQNAAVNVPLSRAHWVGKGHCVGRVFRQNCRYIGEEEGKAPYGSRRVY
jgi:hypothetical protein